MSEPRIAPKPAARYTPTSRLTARKGAALRPSPYRVSVAHVPRDPIARIEHRLGVLERAEALRWHHLIFGLEDDIAKAAAVLTGPQREALVDWLRREEWHSLPRQGNGETAMLGRCRRQLGDAEPVLYDVLQSHMQQKGPASNVIDLLATLKERRGRLKGLGKELA
jgi:hypothetical protein